MVLEFCCPFGEDVGILTCLSGPGQEDFSRFVNWTPRCDGRNVWLGFTTPSFGREMRNEGVDDEKVLSRALAAFHAAFPEVSIRRDLVSK